MKNRIIFIGILSLLTGLSPLFAQQISGDASPLSGVTRNYYFPANTAWPGISWDLDNDKGTITVLPNSGPPATPTYNIVVQWNTPGSDVLRITSNGSTLDTHSVNVRDPRLEPPGYNIVYNCGNTVITPANPPSGADYWWQTSPSGTDTTPNDPNVLKTINSTDNNLYLRARLSSSPFTWGDNSSHPDGTVYSSSPAVPSVANHGTGFIGSPVFISIGTVSGALSYVWYNSSGVKLPTSSTGYSHNLPYTATYYVASKNGCESTGQLAVTATVLDPKIIVVGGGSRLLQSGGSVTLGVNGTYDTYLWVNATGYSVGTSSTLAVTTQGKYRCYITKSGVTGTGDTGWFYIRNYIDDNYISSNVVATEGITTTSGVDALTIGQKNQTIQYFDGLGRPAQTVIPQGSPDKKDIIQPVTYDNFGRENLKYLPFISTETNGAMKTDPVGLRSNSYNTSTQYLFYQNATAVAHDVRPFAETVLETSPESRPLKDFGPGNDWFTNNKSVDYQYLVNQDGTGASQERIIAWKVNGSAMPVRNTALNGGTGYYPTGTLTITSTKDEQGNEVRMYNDENGRMVLKKVYATGTITDLNNVNNWAQTYYIYDDFGSLRFVLQPELTRITINSGTDPGSTDLDNLAFQYKYDERKRMIEKRIPGAQVIYMVYDNRDRLVLTQDGKQRALSPKEWTFTKYNIFNRPVLTGKYGNNNDRSAIQTAVNSYYNGLGSGQAWYETYIAGGSGNVLGYNNASFPQSTNLGDYYTATYYDAYDSFMAPSGYTYINEFLPGQAAANFTRINGLVAGTQVKNLSTGVWMRTVNYFDEKYRQIQSVGDHHKGTVRVSNAYDFAGKLMHMKRTYVVNGTQTTVKESYTYDHAGRQLLTKHSVNGATDVVLSRNRFNELGQLIAKDLHNTDYLPVDAQIDQSGVVHATTITRSSYNSAETTLIATNSVKLTPGFNITSGSSMVARIGATQAEADALATFTQAVDYRYNIRSWLTRINNADVSAAADGNAGVDYFGMELAYNNSMSGLTTNAAYNGNISAVKWSKGYGGSVAQQSYTFGYDPMNRLKDAFHFDYENAAWASNNNAYGESQTYDLNGNILTLLRKGYNGNNLDNLTYGYTGNKLNYVHDSHDAAAGFINGNTGTDDYAYDENGNLYKDKNKGILSNGDIKYNYLNLVQEVVKGSESIKYIYDATGRKLAQEVYSGSTLVKYTDYIGELVFEGNVLKFIQHAEGRYIPTGAEYQYHLKDHLGNIRVSFTTKAQTATNYTANLETGLSGSGEGVFTNYSATTFDLVDHTDEAGTSYQKVQWLNGGTNGRVGLGKSLSVMPGDQVTVSAYGKYMNLGSTGNGTSFATALASAFGVSSGSTGEQLKLYNGLTGYAALVPGGDHPADDEGAPKAFVTILFFDKNYNLVDAAWDQMTTAGAQTSPTVKQPPHDLVSITAKAPEAGYAYIFLSNEHPTFVDIYFDDVTVGHTPSPIVSSSDYFPFGLSYNAGEREGGFEQKYLYNGKELQDELSVNWYDYGARMYMPEIGRWGVIDPMAEKYRRWSPYNYGVDNPIRFIDPDGMLAKDNVDDGRPRGAKVRVGTHDHRTITVSYSDGKDSNHRITETHYKSEGSYQYDENGKATTWTEKTSTTTTTTVVDKKGEVVETKQTSKSSESIYQVEQGKQATSPFSLKQVNVKGAKIYGFSSQSSSSVLSGESKEFKAMVSMTSTHSRLTQGASINHVNSESYSMQPDPNEGLLAIAGAIAPFESSTQTYYERTEDGVWNNRVNSAGLKAMLRVVQGYYSYKE